MSEIQIKPAKASDLESIIDLLNYYKLVVQDIDFKKQNFLKLVKKDELVGIGAVEFYQSYGLLRSIAVNPDKRKQGFASQIVTKLEQLAKSENINELYLLTETAESFFAGLDYKKITRESTPNPIKQTNQFSTLCPANAAVMVKSLIPLT